MNILAMTSNNEQKAHLISQKQMNNLKSLSPFISCSLLLFPGKHWVILWIYLNHLRLRLWNLLTQGYYPSPWGHWKYLRMLLIITCPGATTAISRMLARGCCTSCNVWDCPAQWRLFPSDMPVVLCTESFILNRRENSGPPWFPARSCYVPCLVFPW